MKYEIRLEVREFNRRRAGDVASFARGMCPSLVMTKDVIIQGNGQEDLSPSAERFANQLADGIFTANGGPCKVEIRMACLNNLPFMEFKFNSRKAPREHLANELVYRQHVGTKAMVGYHLSNGKPMLQVKNHEDNAKVSFDLRTARQVATMMLHALNTMEEAKEGIGPPSFVRVRG